MSEMNEFELSENISNITELPWATYNKYFEVTSKDNNLHSANYVLIQKHNLLSTDIESSSNLNST